MIHTKQPSKFSAKASQTKRLIERHRAKPMEIICCGLDIKVLRGVYKTSADTELMCETVNIHPEQTFLEIGCGTGIISIILGRSAKYGIGSDINKLAVKNSQYNARRHNVKNVQFMQSDVFENIEKKFDIIICNPPYNNFPAKDNIDKMFWDTDNEMKKRFFKDANKYLNDNGVIYFGWANFSDLDIDLPFRLAKENNLQIINIGSKISPHKKCIFYVITIKKI